MLRKGDCSLREQFNMAKKRKKNKMPYLIAAAMSVLAAASVGLFFYSGGFHPAPAAPKETVTEAPAVPSVTSEGFVQTRTPADCPLMATDLPNVYVAANPYGLFRFYSYTDAGFVNIPDVQEKEITVTCSHQKIPTKLYYIEQDGAKTGYGLFMTTLYEDDVRLYNYAFFHMTDMPQSYGKGDALLLVDFDEDDFAREDKTYSEVFSLNLSNGKTELLTSENGRTVDNLARMRTDWAQLNDALLRFGGEKLYLSGRNYQLDSTTADIIYNADTSRTKPTWVASGLYKKYLYCDGEKLYYVKQTDSGFDTYCMDGERTETKIGSFEGSVDDYLFRGDYMLQKNTLALTRISTGESKDKSKEIMTSSYALGNPTYFSVSPDGTKLVILFDGETQQAALVNLAAANGEKVYELVQQEGLFTTSCDQCVWLSDDMFLTTAETTDAYETLVWKF